MTFAWPFFAAVMLTTVPVAVSPVQPTDAVTLSPGERASLWIEGDGRLTISDRTSGVSIGDFDRATLDVLLRSDPAAATGANAIGIRSDQPGLPPAPNIAPDRVRATFILIAKGSQTLLIMENGYDRGLLYRARITANGRSAPTDVCLVIPRGRGHEHWPFAIERIELSSLHLEAWDESQGPRCE